MQPKRTYGYIKSKPDDRDHLVRFSDDHVSAFRARFRTSEPVNPPVYDLRKIVSLPQGLSEIDQGQLGSCTANAIAYAYAFDEIKQNNTQIFLPSRLFIYYNERLIEGTVDQDAGAEIRDGLKSINKYGICDEHHWIYDPLNFKTKPSSQVYEEASSNKKITFAKIDLSGDKTGTDITNHLKRSLQSGFPFVFGFTVYSSFESEEVAKTGIMPMPNFSEKNLGGHAVCAVGYDDSKKSFIVKNSWGSKWGLDSYFYMPYDYFADPELIDEFWVIQVVADPKNIPGFTPEDINPYAQNLDKNPNDIKSIPKPENSIFGDFEKCLKKCTIV
jgi:C1A family cysteine protease